MNNTKEEKLIEAHCELCENDFAVIEIKPVHCPYCDADEVYIEKQPFTYYIKLARNAIGDS